MHVETFGNLFVENEYGLWFQGFDDSQPSVGDCTMTNDTVAWNEVGIQLDGDLGGTNTNIPEVIYNVIVWDNGDQMIHNYTSGDPWDPTDGTYTDLKYSNWEGLFSGSCTPTASNRWNIDCDPDFIGTYELDTGSPCIDAGTNNPPTEPIIPRFDVEGGDLRQLDGDWDCTSTELKVIDMGAQEYPGDCE